MQRKKLLAVAVSAFTVFGIFAAAPSHAETFSFQSSPLTNLDPAGATINGGFAKFPTTAGMYIQECVAPVGTARPVTCSDTIQLWVTSTGAQGSISSTGPIALKVASTITGKGVTVDCTKVQCGLFFRLDHTAPMDFSEDKFFPITFKAGAAAPALPADEITVTLNGQPLTRNVPVNLAYRDEAKIVATAKSGLPVTLSSLTPDCTITNGVFVALKGSGQCALAETTAGNATVAPSSANYPFILVPGTQKVTGVITTLKKGAMKALPIETNFGSVITYSSVNKNCRVEGNMIQSLKSGTCVVTATAPAKDGMWNALKVNLQIKSK